jgi:hypothetical protein
MLPDDILARPIKIPQKNSCIAAMACHLAIARQIGVVPDIIFPQMVPKQITIKFFVALVK